MRNLTNDFGMVVPVERQLSLENQFRSTPLPDIDNIAISIGDLEDGFRNKNLKPYYVPGNENGDLGRIMGDIGAWLLKTDAFNQQKTDPLRRLDEYRISLYFLPKENPHRSSVIGDFYLFDYILPTIKQEDVLDFTQLMVHLDRDRMAFDIQNAIRYGVFDMDEIKKRPSFGNTQWEQDFRYASHPFPDLVASQIGSLSTPQLIAA